LVKQTVFNTKSPKTVTLRALYDYINAQNVFTYPTPDYSQEGQIAAEPGEEYGADSHEREPYA